MSVLMRRENTLIIEPGSDISKIQIINFILLPNSKKHFEGPPLQQSYENGQKWMRELKEQYGNIPSYFVANKAENESNIISKLQVEDFAKRYNSKAFFTSAKTGLNIADVFQNIGEDIMQKGVATNKNTLSLEDDNTSSQKTKGCC
ncbi:Rab1a [Hexamita inflata]|uniref:Rab1a n=1 Tax=Hexamita inflata TaxID=28002 RepID=A0AA86UD58_9EUKA|nr:Rab1a [Hexamita inflata]